MSRLIVFGATGGTGRQVMEQALQAGHEVTAVVRNPQALGVAHARLKVIKGDVLQRDTYAQAMNEQDVVISCLGIPKAEVTTLYSDGMSKIIEVMKEAGVSRIMCISSGAITIPPGSSFIMTFLLKNVLQRIYKPVYADMQLMEEKVKASALQWTIVRAPKLTDGKRTNKYRIVTGLPLRKIPVISRADLAGFLISHIHDEQSYRSTVEVAY